MPSGYDPATIEPKWQQRWEEEDVYVADDDDTSRPKRYILDMFPYPSGEGLHLGHVEIYTISDVFARVCRHQGFNVLHPMGWDAFGLPAERYAVRNEVHPREAVRINVDNFRRQLKSLGCSYDWTREINTTDPSYYKWTQWIFLKLHEQGLAYEAEVPVNWCEALGTVLANEEVIDGKSEQGGHPVERRPMRQWLLKITAYAERLLADLDTLDWPDSLKQMQRKWIGRSEGADITFRVDGTDMFFVVFTTRPDTLFGATFCVLAPEHPLVAEITSDAQRNAVDAYVAQAARRSERDRIADAKEKSGVFTGATTTNPATGAQIPIWIADYVLMGYGTGAIMAVPGQDQRDWDFAKAFDLPVIRTVRPPEDFVGEAFEGDGVAINSGFLDGLEVAAAKQKMIDWLTEEGLGAARTTYRLRDWLFSRQRYWGEPFPVIHREDGKTVVLGEDTLPITLPDVASYKPTGTGESPLAGIDEWVNTTDPADGAPARRETNTMPQWAGSCWYYLRYLDPHNDRAFVDPEKERQWMPVDVYVGGVEHAVLHLLYARFWHKVLYDCGLVSSPEPFQRLINQGMILAPAFRNEQESYVPPSEVVQKGDRFFHEGKPVERLMEKMSKSKLNGTGPDEVVSRWGADTLRLYMLFMGPPEADKIWDHAGIAGISRFLHRAWRLLAGDERAQAKPRTHDQATGDARRAMHEAIEGIRRDVDAVSYNTAVSKLMVLCNAMHDLETVPNDMVRAFLALLSPFAPHMADELWERCGLDGLACQAPWPEHDPTALVTDTVAMAVQVNGKVRGHLEVPAGMSDEDVLAAARALPNVARYLNGASEKKALVVKGRLVVFAVG